MPVALSFTQTDNTGSATVGSVERFAGPDKLVAYLGLNPSVHQSGEDRPRHGRITKQGPAHARSIAGGGGLASCA
jgi:transposase